MYTKTVTKRNDGLFQMVIEEDNNQIAFYKSHHFEEENDFIKRCNKIIAFEGIIPNELDEQFLYNLTATELLVKIANGEIDAKKLAEEQLKNRGLNNQGVWVGFRQ